MDLRAGTTGPIARPTGVLAIIGGPLMAPHATHGLNDYRRRALKAHGEKCSGCGYSQFVEMLDAHHVDGDRANGLVTNLEILCVWCHALKTRRVGRHGCPGDRVSPPVCLT